MPVDSSACPIQGNRKGHVKNTHWDMGRRREGEKERVKVTCGRALDPTHVFHAYNSKNDVGIEGETERSV